ncbi:MULTISPECIES: enoyl-CoA hydratase/isomerase family protein [unclassified Corynebacterium]|uniref:enoyl-CoA hydratase/isomerase family protein n=1 Tax=unclassified Corynebacterium TaxID=2624378 RepID=UPI00309DD8CF
MTQISDNSQQSASVVAQVSGVSGRLLLNRPKALNSLDLEMVHEITSAMNEWRDDDVVKQIVLYSDHPKAFCAGGDVRTIRQQILDEQFDECEKFFIDEYVMNAGIAEFGESKPYVAIIDGIAMGGGLGVSLHGTHRIITERASAAMPETAIGFVPDVGITHFSQHVKTQDGDSSKAIARFTGLTGYRLNAADLLYAGWGTHFVAHGDLEDFQELLDAEGIDAALAKFAKSDAEAAEILGESKIKAMRPCIEAIFGFNTWAEMESALANAASGAGDAAKECSPEHVEEFQKLLSSGAVLSNVAAVELYAANAGDITVREALDNELKLGEYMRRHPNFVEGVRAVLVDKDRNAAFVPESTADVDVEALRATLK